MPVQNASINALASVPSSSIGILAVVIFIVIIGILAMTFIYFRKFIYGAVVLAVVLPIAGLSKWIASSHYEGDSFPLKALIYVVGFIIISLIIGHFMQKTGWIKRLENDLK